MAAKEYLSPEGAPAEGAPAEEPGSGPGAQPADQVGAGRRAWFLVVIALLLGLALLVAALVDTAHEPELRLITWAVPGGLVIILVGTAARTMPPRSRKLITGTVAGVVACGVLATVIVPAALPRLGLRGTGIVWTADSADVTTPLKPLAVQGGTAVLDSADGVLLLDLAEGSMIGRIAAPALTERPIMIGDGLLIDSADGYRRYDLAGRVTWPDPVPADRVVAYDAGVTALADCQGGSCMITGYDPAGARVWQFAAPFTAFHRPDRTDLELTELPTQLAVRDEPGPSGAPRWHLYSAATGARVDTIEGKAIQLIDRHAITLTGDDLGPCLVRLQTGPTEAIDCASPWSTQVRDGLLIIEQPNGFASILRPGDELLGGELFETAAASGRAPGIDAGELGLARLTGDTLEAWRWQPFAPVGGPPAWRSGSLPVVRDPASAAEPQVALVGATVAVLGDAPPGPFGIAERESELLLFDLTDGTSTAQVRFDRVPAAELRDRILAAGAGQALLTLPGRAPILIGRPF